MIDLFASYYPERRRPSTKGWIAKPSYMPRRDSIALRRVTASA